MADIFTHDFIDLTTGILSKTGVLWGKNALQSITIARQTPRTPHQAIGYLGIVDYSRGVVTSDLSLDSILVEQCAKAFPNGGAEPDASGFGSARSVYSYGRQKISVGIEEYVLTSMAVAFQAGAPATANYGYLTAGMASSLGILAQQPPPRKGEEDPFAVVMGDDGSGLAIAAEGGTMQGAAIGQVSYIDPQTGLLSTFNDGGIPAGLQSLNFSARINRDNVLDVRSVVPVQFTTIYPIDVSCEMTLHVLPTDGRLDSIARLIVKGAGRSYTNPTTRDPNTDVGHSDEYVRAVDLKRQTEQESISVGRYRAFTMNFSGADLWVPIEETPAGTLD